MKKFNRKGARTPGNAKKCLAILPAIMILLLQWQVACGQQYKVSTTQQDSFSLALVNVLRAATAGFESLQGDSLRYTWLGTDYALRVHFPGSRAGIVRRRDWDVNAYIEFRGFATAAEQEAGIDILTEKIRRALGTALRPDTSKRHYPGYRAFALQDEQGYFSMNMELLGGRTSSPVYLLGPDDEPDSLPKEFLVLLKIYGGTPAYQFYVRDIPPTDPVMDRVIKELVRSAASDFASLRPLHNDKIKPPKRVDTLVLHGRQVVMYYRGNHYFANLSIPYFGNQDEFYKWHRVIQSALGMQYVYRDYNSGEFPSAIFYGDGQNLPRVSLAFYRKPAGNVFIMIRIESSVAHPVSRAYSNDDY